MAEVLPHEAEFNVRYSRRYCERHARMYRRIASHLRLLQTIGALSGFTAFLKEDSMYAGIAGLIIAISLGIDLVFSPSEKARQCEASRQKYAELFAQLHDEAPATIDKRWRQICAESCSSDVEGLRNVAYNDVLREMGYPAEDIKSLKASEGLVGKAFRAIA